MRLYDHLPHPWIAERRRRGPVRVKDQHGEGLSARLAVLMTAAVSTMACAALFALLALVALPSALHAGTYFVIVWLSSTFLQLVFLPILAVGQQVQGKAADKRAQLTFDDAEAVLHEAVSIQEHLAAQDSAIMEQEQHLTEQSAALAALTARLEGVLLRVEGTRATDAQITEATGRPALE